VVSRIPAELIDMIGPAPSVGRRSWMELSDLLSTDKVVDRAKAFLGRSEIAEWESEDRFKALMEHLKPRPQKAKSDVWATGTGARLAKVTHNDTRVEILIDRREAPEFAAFVLDRLKALFEEHRSKN
jgi:ParB family transcriptional regulator, chromosome partitioning protein